MTPKLVVLFCLLALTLQMGRFECDIKGCESCSAFNICEKCSEDYVMKVLPGSSESVCMRAICPENCATCNELNQCEVCEEGFLLSESGSCDTQKQLNSVSSRARILEETQPSNGNYTEDSYANCTIPGCKVCGNSLTCAQCQQNFTKTDRDTCMSCKVANCKKCSAPDVCQLCDNSNGPLSPSPNGAACVACLTNYTNLAGCVSCSSPNSCGLCSNGFELYAPEGESGVCVKCSIPFCDQCGVQTTNSTNSICKKCYPGFSPSASGLECNLCLFPCDSCIDGATWPNNCATCLPPFFYRQPLANGTCVVKLIPGCEQFDPNDVSKCLKCEAGYTLNTTDPDLIKCEWGCSDNCIACTNSTVCSQCARGFYKTSAGLCSKCNTKGCAICSDDGVTCTQCVKGFYLLDSECKVCPGFCGACTSNSTCTELVISTSLVLLIIDGRTVLAVCDSNCITCSNLNPQNCLECKQGFFLRNGKCRKCAGTCQTCDQNDRNKCLTCFPNSFLSDNTCTSCNPTCKTCQGLSAPNVCTSCPDGFYLQGSSCVKGCPQNCLSCSSKTTCTECLSGYTLFKQETETVCAPCISSCRKCAEGQPSACLDCGEGFYLAGTSCTACPENCIECSAQTCTKCDDGFFLTSQLTCAQNCVLPCATCSSVDPTSCTSCIAGYSFDDVSKSCIPVITCSGSGCLACPLGYALKQGVCLKCTSSNCQSCDPDDLSVCYSAIFGYYISETGVSEACPSQCKTCTSSLGCVTCAKGYTKNRNALSKAGGVECVKCESPCVTCSGSPNKCKSCIDGFGFFGWKCARRFRFVFKIKLMVKLSVFNRGYFSVLLVFGNLFGNVNAITINSIRQGSVDLDGSAAPNGDPGSTQAAQQMKALNDLISSGNLAGMPVGEASLTVAEGTVGTLPEQKSNTVGIILVIVGLITLIVYKKRQPQKLQYQSPEGSQKNFNNQSEDKFEPGL